MSIVNMNFVVSLVNAELPKLLLMLEEATMDFHEIGVKHALANAHLSIALHTIAAGHISDSVVASADSQAIAAQCLQCELDQHRALIPEVQDFLLDAVLDIAAVERVGDVAVFAAVFGEVGVEEVAVGGVGHDAEGEAEGGRHPDGGGAADDHGTDGGSGLGGGAASSMDTGSNIENLDFDSVQRGNPEIERRARGLGAVLRRVAQVSEALLHVQRHRVINLGPDAAFCKVGAQPVAIAFGMPYAYLLAVALVYGRMASDRELVALRIMGMPPRAIVAPVVALGAALASAAWLCSDRRWSTS